MEVEILTSSRWCSFLWNQAQARIKSNATRLDYVYILYEINKAHPPARIRLYWSAIFPLPRKLNNFVFQKKSVVNIFCLLYKTV